VKISIIDYGSGNLHSAKKAFERAVNELGVNAEVTLTSNPEDIKNADKIVLPGVGAFGDCWQGLSSIDGMIDMLNEQVISNKKPFLGICVGMQLLAEKGFENGEFSGLGWFKDSRVEKISPSDTSLKIPHMGWNSLKVKQQNKVFDGLQNSDDVYFVHSYAMKCPAEYIVATTDYGGEVTAVIAKDNIMGFQFHPEKSQKAGIELIKNFLKF
jgi:glutamine amidotransferase